MKGLSLLNVLFFMLLSSLLTAFELPTRSENGVTFSDVAPGDFPNREDETSWDGRFNTKIILRTGSGAPYGGVYLRIYDASGIKLLGHLCEKSQFYMKLSPGDYHVIAVDRYHVQHIVPFHVPESGLKTFKITWALR